MRSPSLSRVDMVIGLFISVLLVGLFLTGIGHLNESANRTKCRNNLKQFGLAVQNCFVTRGTLPHLVDQGRGAPTGRGLPSLFANLMPFLEASPEGFYPDRSADYYNAHSSVEFSYRHKNMPHTQIGGMANKVNPMFLDPADQTAEQRRDVLVSLPDGTTGYYATSSYAANGMIPWGDREGTQLFPKGNENTVLFAERPQICRTAKGDEIFTLWGVGFYSPNMPAFACLTPTEPPGLWSTGQIAPIARFVGAKTAESNAQIRVKVGLQDSPVEMCECTAPFQQIKGSRSCDARLPGSSHLKGMQVAMADASVRDFGWETSARVFWAACLWVCPNE